MRVRRLRTMGALIGIVTSIQLSACSMINTVPLDIESPVGCLNAAGAYFLPKKLLTVSVVGKDSGGGALRGYGLDIGDDWATVPDRDQSYCLDYLGSITSRDEVGIIRSDQGLLKRIYTRAEDKSVEIAKTLIDTGFLLAVGAGREGLLSGADNKVYSGPFQFDPFDPYEAAKINAALRSFGYCVFVEGLSFPPGVAPTSWCDDPKVFGDVILKAPPVLVDPLPPPVTARRGVLYRPNITRTLTVLRKADPRGRGSWKLLLTKQVEVPNRAPVFAVEVNRSFFVDRVTDLEFSDGVLTNVSVKKPSEAAAFVEIPLAVVSAVVALPGTIVKLKINDANNAERLIRAQTELIAIRRQHKRDVDDLIAARGPGSTAGLPLTPDNRSLANPAERAIAIQNCLSTGKPQDLCERQWSDILN